MEVVASACQLVARAVASAVGAEQASCRWGRWEEDRSQREAEGAEETHGSQVMLVSHDWLCAKSECGQAVGSELSAEWWVITARSNARYHSPATSCDLWQLSVGGVDEVLRNSLTCTS